jgi:glycosyltransferase 2 family protein
MDGVMTSARRFWPLARTLAGAAILGAVVWRLGTGAFLDGLRVIDLRWAAVALAVGFLTTVVSAWRWRLIARRLGLELRVSTAVGDCYRATLLNSVLPAGVLGDVHRAVSHGRRSGDVGRGVSAVVLERFAGQIVLMVIGAAILLTQPALLTALADRLAPDQGVAMAVAGVLLALVCVWAVAGRRDGGPAWRRAVPRLLGEGRRGLFARDVWPLVTLLSAVGVAGHLLLLLAAARAAGAQAPAAALLPPLVLALLAMGLPLNVGGWGPREAVSALAFGAAGLGAAQGLTVAVAYGMLALVSVLPGVVVLVFRDTRLGRTVWHGVSRTAVSVRAPVTTPSGLRPPLAGTE